MRWLDIDLTCDQDATRRRDLLDRAHARRDALLLRQKRDGTDSPNLLPALAELGQLLFRAAGTVGEDVFAPDRETADAHSPDLDGAAGSAHLGYHLVVAPEDLVLPWTCLHNGVRFLIEEAAVCAGHHGSAPTHEARPWSRRWEDLVFTERALGPTRLADAVRRFRPEACAEPGILFLDGYGGRGDSSRTREERELLRGALETRGDGERLAALETPTGPMTPSRLARTGNRYQAFHFSDVTSSPATASGMSRGWEALARDLAFPPDDDDDVELVGVDPMTALLDQVVERAESGRLNAARPSGSAGTATVAGERWLLEDGPITPEDLARYDATPPLVFSNSYLGLPSLGPRFLKAGASAFVGPHLAVAPHDSSRFAADFYRALARGANTAGALRQAALACRDRRGPAHPAWLSYGILGSGALALQYL